MNHECLESFLGRPTCHSELRGQEESWEVQFKLGFLNHPSVLSIRVLGIRCVSYGFALNSIAYADDDLKGMRSLVLNSDMETRRVEGRSANVDCREGQQEPGENGQRRPQKERGLVTGLLGQ